MGVDRRDHGGLDLLLSSPIQTPCGPAARIPDPEPLKSCGLARPGFFGNPPLIIASNATLAFRATWRRVMVRLKPQETCRSASVRTSSANVGLVAASTGAAGHALSPPISAIIALHRTGADPQGGSLTLISPAACPVCSDARYDQIPHPRASTQDPVAGRPRVRDAGDRGEKHQWRRSPRPRAVEVGIVIGGEACRLPARRC